MSTNDGRLIYIGGLPEDIRSKDLEELFSKYGKINFIDLKNRDKPGTFGFVQFASSRDALEAIRERDAHVFRGVRLKVELSTHGSGAASGGTKRSDMGKSIGRRSNYRCIISGLPPTGSWQDLKDHMREAGNVCYADVFKDGTGVVEFIHKSDMKYAVRKLDDSKFRSHQGETSYIKVRMDPRCRHSRSRSRSTHSGKSSSSSGGRSKSRSRSPRGERATPTYSPVRDSHSRSRSKSPTCFRSRSRSR